MRKRIKVLYLMILVSAVLYTLLWYGKINIKRAIYDQNGNVFRLLTVITETEDKQCGKNTTRQTLPQLQNTSDTQKYEETNQNLFTFTVNKTMRIFTQVSQHNVFIFSAFRREVRGKMWIIINGWLTQKFDDNVNFYCCLALSNKQFRMEKVISKTIFRAYIKVSRMVFQYRCPGHFTMTNNSIIAATIVWSTTIVNRTKDGIYESTYATCSEDIAYHYLATSIVPEQSKSRENATLEETKKNKTDFSFGVCAKLAYGNLNENLTIEWMEYHRKLGVSKVLLYVYSLSKRATDVLQYYQEIGFVNLIEFDIPLTDIKKSSVGAKNMQAFADEQITVYDCHERLVNYKYVSVTDVDEFFLLYKDNTLQDLFERLNKINPKVGVFVFSSTLHIVEWNKFRPKDETLIGSYLLYSTSFTRPSYKDVFRPDRVPPGKAETHVVMEMYPSFHTMRVDKNIALLSHYRKCRPEWSRKWCFSMEKHNDTTILQQLDGPFRNNLKQTKQRIFKRK